MEEAQGASPDHVPDPARLADTAEALGWLDLAVRARIAAARWALRNGDHRAALTWACLARHRAALQGDIEAADLADGLADAAEEGLR